MKLQGSEVQDHETLQSQIGKIAENRLPLSGLEILHGRLTTPSRFISERYTIFVSSPARRATVNLSLTLRPRARDCANFDVVECDASVVAF
jgi:hypothetical protein